MQNVDSTAVDVEHLAHQKEGYELRYRNGNNKERSPQRLELDALLVDKQSDYNTEDVVDNGCQNSPDQGPFCQLYESFAHVGSADVGEYLTEGVESLPAEQLADMLMVVACERDQDHEDQRHDGKEK